MRRSLPVGLILFGCIFGAYGVHIVRAGGLSRFRAHERQRVVPLA
jgi:hypothetical protein